MATSQLGGWLRHAREARGLTVEAIASQTKIPTRHLQALERGDVLTLPAFYQRAEVRAVARAVGVDERAAVEQLDAALTPPEPAVPAAAPVPAKCAARVHSEYVLAACVVAVLVVALGWGPFERAAARERAAAAPAAVTPAPAAVVPGDALNAPAIQTVADQRAEPAVVPAAPAQLVIRTQPAGARVTVNGIGWGASPVTIRHVDPGEKRIRVTMDGYKSSERSVMVDQGAQQTIRIRLTEGGL